MKILRIDSNVDSNLYSGELAAIEAELIENFASTSKDEHEIQIAQPDLLLFGRR